MSLEEFNPDTAIDQYMVKKAQVQMIIDRGYSPINLTNNYDDTNFLNLSKDDMIIYSYNNAVAKVKASSIFNAIYDKNGHRIGVFYLEVEKDGKEVPKQAVVPYTQGDVWKNVISQSVYVIDKIIFISPRKLNSYAMKEVEILSDNGKEVRIFTWIEMLSLVPNHVFNGISKIMDKNEEVDFINSMIIDKELLKSYKRPYANALPNFNTTDPIPKYYDARPGDLIQTHTKVFTHDSVLRETLTIRRVI
jgi:DNA-directed RNA polymerase subunit H (RpoH/RPB5)